MFFAHVGVLSVSDDSSLRYCFGIVFGKSLSSNRVKRQSLVQISSMAGTGLRNQC